MMVPLSEYTTVPETATLVDAFKVLKNAQVSFDRERYRHRAILVVDEKDRFVDKLSQHDVIEALEHGYRALRRSRSVQRLGFSDDFVESTLDQYRLWEHSLEKLCKEATLSKCETNHVHACRE
jgi:hypothetical protein